MDAILKIIVQMDFKFNAFSQMIHPLIFDATNLIEYAQFALKQYTVLLYLPWLESYEWTSIIKHELLLPFSFDIENG